MISCQAVPNGDEVIPLADELQQRFDLVVATKDWHPVRPRQFRGKPSREKIG
jgi:nicotinamidase/pyrazinamidase